METNTLYVWVHPDFTQVDSPEVKAWQRSIMGLGEVNSSGLVLVPWNLKSIGQFNDLASLCVLAQSVLRDRFFRWTKGRFILPENFHNLPENLRMNKKTARCYGLVPSFCVQDQTDYLKGSGFFNQVFNEGYYPGDTR